MRIFSTFSGIGGFEIGIENAYRNQQATEIEQNRQGRNRTANEGGSNVYGGSKPPLCVGYSEIDKYAISVYERNFPNVRNFGDITKINAKELPDFDCLVGGFPCQAFSIAGKRRGFEDTRGTLFFDLARILREKQPRYFVFENVKGLLSHDNGNTFRTIIAATDELGYDCQWQVLNSKNHGVPQNRERVYIVGHLRGTPRPEVFPIESDHGETTNEVTAKGQLVDLTRREPSSYRERTDGRAGTLDANYYKGLANQERPGVVQPFTVSKIDRKNKEYTLKDTEISGTLTATMWKGIDALNRTGVKQLNQPTHSNDRVYASDGISPTLNTMQGGNRQPFIAAQRGRGEPPVQQLEARPDDITNTITSVQKDNMVLADVHIRRLTPIECERLQGFPDNWTAQGTDGAISDTQRYKMCGNAVTTNVVQAVFERLLASASPTSL